MIKTSQKRTEKKKQEDLLDALYREVIRRRAMRLAKGCQCCLSPKLSYTMLHTAHLHSRGKRTVRWDVRNSAGICYLCHRFLDTHRFEKEAFFRKLLGDEEYDKLDQLAHMTTKDSPVDYDGKEIELRVLLKRL